VPLPRLTRWCIGRLHAIGEWRGDWGIWRTSAGGARFLRTSDGVWRYGRTQRELAGLPVVSAIDLTLDELVAARTGESLRRPARMRWNDGLPHGMRHDGLYLAESDARRVTELGTMRWARAIRGWTTHAIWIPVDAAEWGRFSKRVVGLRAPELSASTDVRMLAEAERTVRARRASRARAAARRRTIARRLAHEQRLTCGQLARVLGVTRERAHQLLHEPEAPHAALFEGADVTLHGLKHANDALSVASAALTTAREGRRALVLTANRDLGIGLGQIADILGVSRAQAQQLRNAGVSDKAT
jgi:hypothetical protein